MNDVRQCPYCELRFPNRAELQGHITFDHPGTLEDAVDDDTVPGARPGTGRAGVPPDRR